MPVLERKKSIVLNLAGFKEAGEGGRRLLCGGCYEDIFIIVNIAAFFLYYLSVSYHILFLGIVLEREKKKTVFNFTIFSLTIFFL